MMLTMILILPMIMRTQLQVEIVEIVPEKAVRARMEIRETLVAMTPGMVLLLVVVPGLAEMALAQEVMQAEVMQAEVMQAEVVRLVVLVVEILV